jgi:hypothetical protein
MQEVVFVRIKLAPVPIGANLFNKLWCLDVAIHRIPVEPNQRGNRHLTHALFMQCDHLFITILAPGAPCLSLRFGCRQRLGLVFLLRASRFRCALVLSLFFGHYNFEDFVFTLKQPD